MVLDVNMVPEAIFSHIKTDKVKFHENNGSFVLTPVIEKEKTFDNLIGMFPDGKLSIDGYLKQKQQEKELE
jgi:hypothetical protein